MVFEIATKSGSNVLLFIDHITSISEAGNDAIIITDSGDVYRTDNYRNTVGMIMDIIDRRYRNE